MKWLECRFSQKRVKKLLTSGFRFDTMVSRNEERLLRFDKISSKNLENRLDNANKCCYTRFQEIGNFPKRCKLRRDLDYILNGIKYG